MRLARLPLFLLGVFLGVAGTLVLDPRLGSRRRALLRDKARHYARIAPRRLRGAVRAAQGPIRGVLHTAVQQTPWYAAPTPPDLDEYVKHRVESVLGRRRDLHLGNLNFDAADGVVRVRGTVPDEETARRVVQAAASVSGVRAVSSLMHTPDGKLVPCEAGDTELLHGQPRAALQAEGVRRRLLERWPALTDIDTLIHESGGHPERLAARIAARTGQPDHAVRTALDELLMAAV